MEFISLKKWLCTGLLVLCIHSLAVFSAAQSSKRPNVLLIVIDDLRASLGCYGDSHLQTPNIDNLASKSILFQQAFVQQAVCGPSRTSFLTSRRPDSTKMYDFFSYWREHAGNYTTLPQHFKENGYTTQNIGKIFHPGIASNRSDDSPYSWTYPPYHPPSEVYSNAKVCPGKNGTLGWNVVCPVDVTEMPGKTLEDLETAEQAKYFLRNTSSRESDQPFFLAVGIVKPHLSLKYPKKYKSLYPLSDVKLAEHNTYPSRLPLVAYNPWIDLGNRDDGKSLNMPFPFGPVPDWFQIQIRQSYDAATSYMDAQVGRVLAALEQSGFSNNTIVAFISDHGFALGEHGVWTKYSLFEVAVRVPFIVYIPGVTYNKTTPEEKIFPFFDVFLKPNSTGATTTPSNGSTNKPQASTTSKPSPGVPQSWVFEPRYRSSALVELVDLFPTLAEAADLPTLPVCPIDTFNTRLCTEGASLMPLIRSTISKTAEAKDNSGDNNSKISQSSEQNLTYSLAEKCSKDFIIARSDGIQWKSAAFSQYPRPGVEPKRNTELPRLVDIRIMGYSMWTPDFRYTEWVKFNPENYTIDWEELYGRELYLRSSDPHEINNMAMFDRCFPLVQALSKQLKIGWRGALPK